MDLLQKIRDAAAESGFTETGCVPPEKLHYLPEVRKICEGNVCRNYGATWACPPAVGTLEECRERVSRYGTMLLFSKKYQLEDSFDFHGMLSALRDFKQTVDMFNGQLKALVTDCLLLSNEGCGRCETCTYPSAPCRFPGRLYHSLEGYGFSVSELAAAAGLRYNNGVNTVTFFGALLFNGKETAGRESL